MAGKREGGREGGREERREGEREGGREGEGGGGRGRRGRQNVKCNLESQNECATQYECSSGVT